MKEIGEKLKDTREEMGISLEEAAEDMKVKIPQIENIEAGNIEAFKDIFYLKYFIRDYSKYLGLKYDDMVNEFNEFLFDYTSKISLKDIKEAQKKIVKKDEVRVVSPYTASTCKQKKYMPFILYSIIFVLLVLTIYFIFTIVNNDKQVDKPIEMSYVGGVYEFTK